MIRHDACDVVGNAIQPSSFVLQNVNPTIGYSTLSCCWFLLVIPAGIENETDCFCCCCAPGTKKVGNVAAVDGDDDDDDVDDDGSFKPSDTG